eukprot:gene1143-12339_t
MNSTLSPGRIKLSNIRTHNHLQSGRKHGQDHKHKEECEFDFVGKFYATATGEVTQIADGDYHSLRSAQVNSARRCAFKIFPTGTSDGKLLQLLGQPTTRIKRAMIRSVDKTDIEKK